MEKKTMGAFLAALRKAHGYTQQEVSDKLNISNKTVSKWERDEGCPEIMMLPAIAELYDVTVDEILRGERIIKTENIQINDEKTEKRAKYLFDKALSRFTNLSFIAISLGMLAVVFAYLTRELSYTYTTKTVCVLLTVLISCASIIIQIVAFNNFRTNFNTEENIINEKNTAKTKKKSLIYLCITIGIVIFAVLWLIAVLNLMELYSLIPTHIFISGSIAFLVYRIMYKKIGADKSDKAVLSPEFFAYRKKNIKITSIFISVVMVVCITVPFAEEIIDSFFSSTGFSFSAAVGYGYDSFAEAENDYNKLKDFFLNGKTLYKIEIDMSPEFDVYKLTANCIDAKFDDEGQVVSADYEIVTEACQTITFDTLGEADAFRYNQCWTNDIVNIYDFTHNVSFNDEDMSITCSSPVNFTLPFDILPVFLLIGSCASILASVISFAIYTDKRKKSTVD